MLVAVADDVAVAEDVAEDVAVEEAVLDAVAVSDGAAGPKQKLLGALSVILYVVSI